MPNGMINISNDFSELKGTTNADPHSHAIDIFQITRDLLEV